MSVPRRGLFGPEVWLSRCSNRLRFRKATQPIASFCSGPSDSTSSKRPYHPRAKKKFDNFDELRDPTGLRVQSDSKPSNTPGPSSPPASSPPASSPPSSPNPSLDSSASRRTSATPYRPQSHQRPRVQNTSTTIGTQTSLPASQEPLNSKSHIPSSPNQPNTPPGSATVFHPPKTSPFGTLLTKSPSTVPPTNLSLALINALSLPVTPKPSQPLSSFRSTNPPRKAIESENQRLYELEQKKLREQQQNSPPSTPMRAWFKNDTSPAATLSPLQGAEVTSVHTAGDITRWKADYRTKTGKPEPADKLRLALSKVAKQKEIFLEQKWHSWFQKQEREYAEPEPVKRERKPRAIATAEDLKVPLVRRTKIVTFSKLTGIATSAIIECLQRSQLFPYGASPTTIIDMAAQEFVCIEFGKTPEIPKSRDVETVPTEPGEPRAPVVCVMGHVDHGKTSLLDRLRKSNVQASEAGGITQSIGAFAVSSGAVFLDTPGHAAFSSMRARGADKNATDLVVLVVAIDSGVQPQTIEAIELAQANDVPIIVAITKCDLGGEDTVLRRQLLAYGLQDEAKGGDTLFVRVSAKTGEGMDDLLGAIGAATELLDLKAPVEAPARAFVIECTQKQGLGCVVNVVVRSGTLSVGDLVVCGTECAKIRALFNEHGERVKSCGPSTPASVVGFKDIDRMGAILRTVESEEAGEIIVSERLATQREQQPSQAEAEREGGRVLRVIIKASTKGSLEAFLKYVQALPQDIVQILVLKSGVGPLLDGDVQLANQLGAQLFGFGAPVTDAVAEAARIKSVQFHTREIIYQLMDDFRDALSKQLPPSPSTAVLGTAEVLQVFQRDGKRRQLIHAAGCRVVSGKLVSRDAKGGKVRYRLLRDGNEVAVADLERLFHFKDEVQVIEKGQECCLVLQGWKDFQMGDSLECTCTSLVHPVFDDSAGRAS